MSILNYQETQQGVEFYLSEGEDMFAYGPLDSISDAEAFAKLNGIEIEQPYDVDVLMAGRHNDKGDGK